VSRKGGTFVPIVEKKNDGTPEDEARHDTSNIEAAFGLANLEWPGVFGVFYHCERPTKNELESGIIARAKERTKNASDLDLLKASFARLR
jgi:2-oxoglutarate ferredoxin oxidoreductase subunit beta